MEVACIVLAAGKSKRFDKSQSKLFYKIKKTPVIEYTLKKILSVFNKKSLYITIGKKITKKDWNYLQKFSENSLIIGGSTRFKSLKNSLKEVSKQNFTYVLIHDAARANVSIKLIKKIKKNIIKGNKDAVIPFLNAVDTIKKRVNNSKYKTIDRNKLILTQTPQAFRLSKLIKELDNNAELITDDVQVIEKTKSNKIKYILGEKSNFKITDKNDLSIFSSYIKHELKIGNGFDIHRLRKGSHLILAGVKIKSNYELVGHSDGDVITHSLIDAILGSQSKGDIGEYFPSTNKNYKNISSKLLLNDIVKMLKFDLKIIKNIDVTVICQHIKLSKYKKLIKKSISSLLECPIGKINVKAKTTDKIGIIGSSKAIASWVTLLVQG